MRIRFAAPDSEHCSGATRVRETVTMRYTAITMGMVSLLCGATLCAQGGAAAAATQQDPAARLHEVLPDSAATQVLSIAAEATSHGLPGAALEQRALKFAARGVPPADIVRALKEQAGRQMTARTLLDTARKGTPRGDEVEAAAEALREGVAGRDVASLAKSAPSGRSLVVPLYVLGSLTTRGLPSDQALEKVMQRLAARASDAELESLPQQALNARNGEPGADGRAIGLSHRPAGVPGAGAPAQGGPPSGVPANPAGRGRPATPPGPPGHPGKP